MVNPVWVDSHCHLEMLNREVADVLESSQQRGVAFCVSIGVNHQSNQKVVAYCEEFERVFGAVGFHPHEASEFIPDHLNWVRREAIRNTKIVAIGECGYDLYYKRSPRDAQRVVFERQLDLAIELNLPVVIHSRDADALTLEMLANYKDRGLNGVIHCFSSDIDQARRVLDLGFYLSFNGICTFPQAERVRDVLRFTPNSRLLLETDAPFLTPVPFRGKKNDPGNVSIVGEYIAELLQIPVVGFSELILSNTLRLFSRIDYER